MRISRDAWAMSMAQLTARRGTCLRRQVGCVLLNARGHVIATGYNGRAAGQRHCNHVEQEPIYGESYTQLWNGKPCEISPCVGFKDVTPHACAGAHAPSGTMLDACEAIHAEQNAMLQCRDVYDIETCYVTVSPCVTCTKLLLNTSCKRIVFAADYADSVASMQLWERADRQWSHFKEE